MKKHCKAAFTLIELIIVIAIIAILAVTAFLVLTKWMGKSRDSRRVNDIGAINSALQIYVSDASLIPLPDSYSGVYDTGYALARYQGNFTDNIASQLSNISKNIKDPQGNNYGYSVTYDRKQYQLRALTESTVSSSNTVYAASQTAKLQGNYAGFVVTATGNIHALWNTPSLFLFTGTVVTSGIQFTGGNVNFLQDNKTIDNTYPVAIVDVSNLYNSSTADDATVYTNIINTFSGTNNITSSSGATAVVQSAAGSVPSGNSTMGPTTPNCLVNASYSYNGHTYSISALTNGQAWSGTSLDVSQNNGIFSYVLSGSCSNGSFANQTETGPTLKSCNSGYYVVGNSCLNKIPTGQACTQIRNSWPADCGRSCQSYSTYLPDGSYTSQFNYSRSNCGNYPTWSYCQNQSTTYCAAQCVNGTYHYSLVNSRNGIAIGGMYYCD